MDNCNYGFDLDGLGGGGAEKAPYDFYYRHIASFWHEVITQTQSYSIFNPDKFIFSKIDESLSLGNLFNLKVKTDIPAAYFTTGQQVPEDIEIAYPGTFARRIFLDYNNNAEGENP